MTAAREIFLSYHRKSQPQANGRIGPVSSIGQRNTYLDRRMWSDDDEARISQDQGFSG